MSLKRGADAGVVISASHNPFDDNGIKFFSDEGLKLSDEEEAEIETRVASGHLSVRSGTGIGSAETIEGALESYVWDVVRRIPLDLSGLRIAVDCANGAMYRAAPLGLSESGADVVVLCADPDGRNINAGCGSTHIEGLQRGGAPRRVRSGAGLRRRRRPRARRRRARRARRRRLHHRHPRDPSQEAADGCARDTVVTTVMTNLGFQHAMEREGIDVVTTAVGDRYVIAEMLRGDYVLGGEQSGHVINREVSTTGDGLATASCCCRR